MRRLLAIAVAFVVTLALGGSSVLSAPTVVSATPSLPHILVGPISAFLPAGHSTPSCLVQPGPPVCYAPAQIQQAYDFPTGANAPTGAGQTIVIVDPYGSPTIQADLAAFDTAFSIPPANLVIVGPNGSGDPNDPGVQSWQFETSMDVEWAHATAPGATIVLAVAPSDDTSDILATEAAVLPSYPGAVVSQSFGVDENDPTPSTQAFITGLHALYNTLPPTDTFLASSGDFGATDGGDSITAEYPASDPLVTGVGGTQGKPYPGGLLRTGNGSRNESYGGESVWNESFVPAASGGAPSILFSRPSWQRGFTNTPTRGVPDVSYNAALNGGILVDWGGNLFVGGGTSAGPPQWAGILALADQLRASAGAGPLGTANPALYAIAGSDRSYRTDFHDITDGNNILAGQKLGFHADHGYDLASGLGTPDVANLIGDLVNVPASPQQKPQNVTCANQQLTGTYRDVTVAKGTWCDLANATVFGDVHVDQASGLGISGTTIAGDVDAGRVSAAADPAHPGANSICGSSIGHDLHVHDSSAGVRWTIGGASCANSIAHDVQFEGNSAGGDISANTIGHDLGCRNDGPVTDSAGPNQVGGHASAQCAALANGSDSHSSVRP